MKTNKTTQPRQGGLRRALAFPKRAWRRWGPEFHPWKGQWHLFALALASALIMRLAFPRWNLYTVAAIGLAPFLWTVSQATSRKQAFYLGWLYGAVFYYVLLIWLNILVVYHYLIPPAILLLGIYLGLFKGLFAVLMWETRRRPWWSVAVVPAAWIATDYLQSLGDLGFPWGYLGHSLWRHWEAIQLVAWTGVYGLSLIFFWVNFILYDVIRCWRRETGAPAKAQLLVLVAALPLFAAAMVFAWRDSVHHFRANGFYVTSEFMVGLVQPNIPQREKFDSYDPDVPEERRDRLQRDMFVKTVQMTYEIQSGLESERCDLIIWPESAMTDDLFTLRPIYATYFRDLATSFGAPLFFGATNLLMFKNGRRVSADQVDQADYQRHPDAYSFAIYNSAFLAEPGRGLSDKIYNKMRLVPFAEGIPYMGLLKPIVSVISAIAQMEPFRTGSDYTVYEIRKMRADGPPLRFGPLICFESIYPGLSRAFARRGAEMLVVITNDAWYEQTAGPAQHQLQAVFRAAETRRWVARCANTGISCFISPLGEIELETPLAYDALPKSRVRGVKELTFYTRCGDLFAWVAVAITACLLAVRLAARKVWD